MIEKGKSEPNNSGYLAKKRNLERVM